MLLNITNGDYLNEKLSKDNDGEFFPFREAIIQGEVTPWVLSEEFITTRALALNVTTRYYKEKLKSLIEFTYNHNEYSKVKLWFGKDTFCQLNLLTLLALLEQIDYLGEVKINIIDDETGEVLQTDIAVTLGEFSNVYHSVLILKQMPTSLGVIDKRAIELYFDYLSTNGYLANLIRENQNLSEDKLVVLLLKNSKEYGLSDLNVKELISRVKIL